MQAVSFAISDTITLPDIGPDEPQVDDGGVMQDERIQEHFERAAIGIIGLMQEVHNASEATGAAAPAMDVGSVLGLIDTPSRTDE